DTVVKIENASNEFLKNINLSLKAGEIVGIAGLQGSGRTELSQALFGEIPFKKGTISINGHIETIQSPAHAIKLNMGFVTEDRKAQGIFPNQPIRDNILVTVRALQKLWVRISPNGIRKNPNLVPTLGKQVDIRASSYDQEVNSLSGGNQQKVILAKWLAPNTEVMIFDEPTRGIDVDAKASIHKMIRDLAKNGAAIMMVSSELPEIIGMSDRIVVMCDGEIAGELPAKSSEADIMLMATGYENGEPVQVEDHRQDKETFAEKTQKAAISGFGNFKNRFAMLRIPPVYYMLIVLFIVGLIMDSIFGRGQMSDPSILMNILVRSVALGIVAIGQTMVMIGASIDLSVAYLISVTAVMSSFIMQGDPAKVPLAVAIVFGIGALVGLVNGLIITKFKVNAFIATMGVGLILRGGLSASFSNFTGAVPESFQTFGYGKIGPIPISVLILLFSVILGSIVLFRTKYGAHLYGVGGNEDVARLSGLRTDRVIIISHIISSLTAVLAGLFIVSRLRAGAPWIGTDGVYDLESIAAVVVGGTALAGGSGNITGSLAGVIIFGVLDTVFNQVGLDTFLKSVLRGSVIILAVASYTIRSKREAS
nr:ATP-binding cassette domain-containing protein [Anaerolineaceae bacterium]